MLCGNAPGCARIRARIGNLGCPEGSVGRIIENQCERLINEAADLYEMTTVRMAEVSGPDDDDWQVAEAIIFRSGIALLAIHQDQGKARLSLTPLGGPSCLFPLKAGNMGRTLAALFLDAEILKVSFNTQLRAVGGVQVEPDPHLRLRPLLLDMSMASDPGCDPGDNGRKSELWTEYLGDLRPPTVGPLDFRKARGDVLALSLFLLDVAITRTPDEKLLDLGSQYGPLEFLAERYCTGGTSAWRPPANPLNQLIVQIPVK